MDIPVARRTASPSWINARTVLGLLLFCLAFLGGERILSHARATTAVWSAAHPLAQGSRLGSDDLVAIDVRLPADQLALYASAESSLEGAVVTRAVDGGELISTEWVSEAAEANAGRTLTLPVSAEHANGGTLRPGDRIDVFATFTAGDAASCTVTLGRALEVMELVTVGGLVVEEEAPVGVTIAATPEQAAQLALAVRTAEIDIARVTGELQTGPPDRVCVGDLP